MKTTAWLVRSAAAFVLVGLPVAAVADDIPRASELIQGLIPDDKAERVYRNWKGIGVTPGRKAESEEIPRFDLHVNFEFGRDELTTDGELLLGVVGRAFIDPKLRDYVFFLAGHTDAVGGDASNMDLSRRRVERVRNFLMDEFGIPPRRLIAEGYGESRLLRPDDPESGLNRRVEIRNIGPDDE